MARNLFFGSDKPASRDAEASGPNMVFDHIGGTEPYGLDALTQSKTLRYAGLDALTLSKKTLA